MASFRKTLFILALILANFSHAGKPVLGKPAPDFLLTGLTSNDNATLSAYKGKVVLLDFWASWCLPCRRLLPMLSEMKARNPDLEILAVSVDVDKDKAISFLRDVEPGLKSARDVNQKAAETYAVEWMPVCFLIDKQGRLRFRHDSYTGGNLKLIEHEAKRLLAEP